MSLHTCSTSIGSASKRICDNYMKHKRKCGYRTPPRTKLDSLLDDEETDTEINGSSTTKQPEEKDDYVSSSEDVEDVVFRKCVQPTRTGNFDLDFPASPKISKGNKEKIKKSKQVIQESQKASTSTTTVNIESTGKNFNAPHLHVTALNEDNLEGNNSSITVEDNVVQSIPETVKGHDEEDMDTPPPDIDINGNICTSGIVGVNNGNVGPKQRKKVKGKLIYKFTEKYKYLPIKNINHINP